MSKPALIVGIDFGTTHSGVSWAVNLGTKDIRLITDWRHPEYRLPNIEKVPSSICYENGKPHRWGYRAESDDNALKWIKVLLETSPRFAEKVALVEKSNELLQRLNKKADEVVADYLRFLWQYTDADIIAFKGSGYTSRYDLQVFLTVPAIWSDEAKERVLSAGKAAGLPQNVTCISEPEAAALYVLRKRADENDIQVGERFIICDAGGATVDLITYEATSLRPFSVKESATGDGKTPNIQFYQIIDQEGELCGSVYLDIAFQHYIVMLTGSEQYKTLTPTAKRKMINNDFDRIKRLFGSEEDGDDEEYSVELRGVKDDRVHGIIDGTIKLERTALQAIFDPVYLKIEELVQEQIRQVNGGVKAIILVGGFGSNKYLLGRLEAAHKDSGIAILTAPNAWSAVSQGAVLWGLEQASDESGSPSDTSSQTSQDSQESRLFLSPPHPSMSPGISTITTRRIRHSYGVQVVEQFNATQHAPEDKDWDSNLRMSVVRQIRWLLKRGQSINTGETVVVPLSDIRKIQPLARNVHASFELFISDRNDPPPWKTSDVRTLCQLKTKLPFYKLLYQIWSPTTETKYELGIELGPAALHFTMRHKGKHVGDVWAEYSTLPS